MVHDINKSALEDTKSETLSRHSSIDLISESQFDISFEPTDNLNKTSENEPKRLRTEDKESLQEKMSHLFKKPKSMGREFIQVTTKNRFEVLGQTEENDIAPDMEYENEEEFPSLNETNQSQNRRPLRKNSNTTDRRAQREYPNIGNQNRVVKPPPIIIQGKIENKTDYDKMTRMFSATLTKGFNVKFTKNSTIIQAKDNKEFQDCKTALENDNMEWHTYASYDEKTHAFVIKGLDHRPDIDSVAEELRKVHKINVKKIYIMETRYRPLYLVVTTSEHKLATLNNQIKMLSNISIQWERRRQNRDIIQCKKCNMWGHATTYCHRAIKCAKCAGPHKTDFQCNNETKCSNCSGPHAANDRTCPIYEYKIDLIRSSQQQQFQQQRQQQTQYMDAPVPKENAWAQRQMQEWQLHQQPSQQPSQQRQQSSQQQRQQSTQHYQQQGTRYDNRNNRESNKHINNNDDNLNNEFTNLNNKLSELNNIINLSEMTRLVDDLIDLIKNCRNKIEKFTIVTNFIIRNVESYDI